MRSKSWTTVVPSRARAVARLALAVGFGVACTPVHPRIRTPEQAVIYPSVAPTLDPRDIAATMSRLRGAAYRGPAEVHVLGGGAFVSELNAHLPGQLAEGREDAFWKAFHFSADDRTAEGVAHAAIDDSTAGFYLPATGQLFVRDDKGSIDEQRFAMAHEIAHSVQGPLDVGLRLGPADEALARLAIVEGDADVTAAAFLASEAHRSIGPQVARIGGLMAEMSATSLMTVAHASPSLASAPRLVRARLVFPYVEGTRFAIALYETGGFALLNAALLHPPVTTQQVLHPEKYLAGELPVRVPAPEVDGRSVVARGTLGELQTSVYLAECMDDRIARQVAEGWRGDSYEVFLDDGGATHLIWSTAWGNDDQATRFEATVRARHCGPIRAPRTFRRDARVLVLDAPVEEGLDPERLLKGELQSVPASPPVGKVALRSLPMSEDDFLHKGHLEEERFISKKLGLAVTVPNGFHADVPFSGPEVTLESDRVRGMVAFLFERHDAAFEAEVAGKIASSVFRDRHCTAMARDAYEIDLDAGRAHVEDLTCTVYHLLAAFLPACGGNGLVLLASAWGPSFGFTGGIAERWFDGVALDDAAVCDYLRDVESSSEPAAP